jgi:hypothetical protein
LETLGQLPGFSYPLAMQELADKLAPHHLCRTCPWL